MTTTTIKLGFISSTVICDSITYSGKRVTTLEVEYPRFILAEFNTHRMLSKNSSSSRAIPTKKILDTLETHYAHPVHWGKNQSGMQADHAIEELQQAKAHLVWLQARNDAIWNSLDMLDLNVHKQVVNRITEPYQIMKTVVTATEWDNFFYLRTHKDAQPEFQELAVSIQQSISKSKPQQLLVGEWHLPYIHTSRTSSGVIEYRTAGESVPLDIALLVSASSCAQVSYRKLDQDIDKAKKIYNQLVLSDPPHMSPVEHQCTPMPSPASNYFKPWPKGISHQDYLGNYWSGNFCGWIQYRKILERD